MDEDKELSGTSFSKGIRDDEARLKSGPKDFSLLEEEVAVEGEEEEDGSAEEASTVIMLFNLLTVRPRISRIERLICRIAKV